MAQQQFRVSNAAGMWLRTEPIVSEATQKVLLPQGHLVTKLGETDKPNWWRISTTVEGEELEGFSNKTLMVPDLSTSDLVTKTLSVLSHVAPHAHPNYLQAIREGSALFEQHGIITALRMAHLLAQAMQETGSFTVLRENMSYSVPRMLQIFGVGKHSARVTPEEAPGLAHNPRALAERVYGLGNPRKFPELGNTEPGDGFRYRGNGILQTTGRDAHRRMGEACGLDFEGNPDLVTLPEHALKPALQEWSDGNLNNAADHNDIRTITIKINGGLNGFEERKAFFAQISPLFNA
ncbi:MAG: glycoside hydrolase family 19 protein [Acidobacteria bacterium]|nr:glycoside hydrolase family 19 protein [Acidobacteriota bacterium]